MKRSILGAVGLALVAMMVARPASAATATFTDPARDTALVTTWAITQGDPTRPLLEVPNPLGDPSVDILGVRVGTDEGMFTVAIHVANVAAKPLVGGRRVVFEMSGDEKTVSNDTTIPLPVGPPITLSGDSRYWLWSIDLAADIARTGGAVFTMQIVSNATPGKPGDTISAVTPIAGQIDTASNEVRFTVPVAAVDAFIHAHTTEPASTFAPGIELRELQANASWSLPVITKLVPPQLVTLGNDHAEGPNSFILP